MGRRKEPMKKINRWSVAIYIRLSKEDGNEMSYSVLNQKQILMRYLDSLGVDFELYDVYIDDGKTGINTDREDFKRMITDIEGQKVNCVLVKDLSRLSRNTNEAGQLLEQYFVEKRVRFISIDIPSLDSHLRPEEVSSMATKLQSMINEQHCLETSKKVRGVLNAKRLDGQFIGAFAPYGYLKDPDNKNKLIVDEEARDVVLNIRDWFFDGMSLTGIARKLNELSIPSPTEYKRQNGFNYRNPNDQFDNLWSARTVKNILSNQMYCGDMVQGKYRVLSYKVKKMITPPEEEWYIVENTHEAIYSREDREKILQMLLMDTKTVRNREEPYLFSGLLKCADCKKAMNRSSKKSGTYGYFVCSTYKNQLKTACTRHSISENELYQVVLNTLNMQLAMIADIETMIENIKNAPKTQKTITLLEKSITLKELEIVKNNRIKDNLYVDWKSSEISRDDYFRMKETFEEKTTKLNKELKILKTDLYTINSQLDNESEIFRHYKKYRTLDKLDRALLLDIIECIYIGENKQIEIVFKFYDQIKLIEELTEEGGKQFIK